MEVVNILKEYYIKYIKKWLPLACMTAWVVYSFFNYYMTHYHVDETWAWNIASDLNFFEIIKLMHREGHTFLWYVVLKPFTYFPNLYPDILKYINWTISFILMLVIWKRTSLSDLIKVLITFSTPFLVLYPTYARPYSMTILILLILTLLFKERLKRPLLYSIVTFFALNCCLNGTIFSGMLSLLFLYDIFKQGKEEGNIKKYKIPIAVIIFGYLSLLIQWIPFYIPNYTEYFDNFELLKDFFFGKDIVYNILSFIIFFPLLQYVLYFLTTNIKDKRYSVLGYVVINFMLFFHMFVYFASPYHLYFIYIYFILIYMLLIDNCEDFKPNTSVYKLCTFFIISVSLIFNYYVQGLKRDNQFFTSKDTMIQTVNKIHKLVPKGEKIYISSTENELFPYLKHDYKLLNIYGEDYSTYTAYKHAYIHEDKKRVKKYKDMDNYIVKLVYKPWNFKHFSIIIEGTYITNMKSW